ncbi:MAG: phosphodiesterase [Deltaproteobacteria bacterium RIFOXYD12_FULL_50_9]|nr:MAG: phosphodiesterase [Deltaproteobacteria bacterium RIFOXYD12_FULL_50_9]
MQRTVVLNVVGLTRSLLSEHTPNLRGLLANSADIKTVTPAVTCSVQATYLTGKRPVGHGIVGNGWYFRDLAEVMFWRQSNRLVQSEKIWQAARNRNPAFTCANSFWWYNMATDVDWAVTPRPIYCADGRKLPDCYSIPPDLRDRFNKELGQFPLFHFWGPLTSIASSVWIARAAMQIEEMFRPTLHLVYLPHLDYILQRVGPQGNIAKDLNEIDSLCGRLLNFFQERQCRVIVLSEYGITAVNGAVHPNLILREAGLLAIKNDLGREYLDPGASRAFAVADHQIAHIYVNNKADIRAVQGIFEQVAGVEQVLDHEGKKAYGLDHERSGDLVLIANSDKWFTYYFWNDDNKAPDYARTVNIHAKPGYDPCELFLDPAISFPKAAIGWTLLKKFLGFRYVMEVVPLNADLVKGSHGRITDHHADQGPLFMTTEPRLLDNPTVEATDVYGLMMDHVFMR